MCESAVNTSGIRAGVNELGERVRLVYQRQIGIAAAVSECTEMAMTYCLDVETECADMFRYNPMAYVTQMEMFCDLLKASRHFSPEKFSIPPVSFCTMDLDDMIQAFLPAGHWLNNAAILAAQHLDDANANNTDSLDEEKRHRPPFMAIDVGMNEGGHGKIDMEAISAINRILKQKVYLDEPCPNCGKKRVNAVTQQLRRGDEGQTLGKVCDACPWTDIPKD